MDHDKIESLIRKCQAEAQNSIENGDPPFGCVIADPEGSIVARGHNTVLSDSDPTAHAEVNTLRQLGQRLGTVNLAGHIMFANAASCPMCTTAALKARITTFYYGAPSEPMNPSLLMEEVAARAKDPIEISGPILGAECAEQIAQGRARMSA